MSGEPILELDQVSAAYGRFRALFEVSFSVAPGSVTALLGPNGAGKSTIARVVSGLVPVTSGRILVAGEDVTGCSAWRMARDGVAFAPEGRSVFATLEVEENLMLTFRRGATRRAARAALTRAYDRFPRLAERRHQLAGTLVHEVYRALREIRDAGTALLVVEQLVPRALEIAEQVVILRKGRVVHAGPVSDLGELRETVLPASGSSP
jgi:branched-chain amino acid transport system ATP-binding protein